MASKIRLTIIFCTLTSLLSVALATPGTATFYTNYVPSQCYNDKGKQYPIAAASPGLWQTGAACDKLFNVTCKAPANLCTGRSVVVKVTDLCRGCSGTLDLPKGAFSAIANPAAGKINIDYFKIN